MTAPELLSTTDAAVWAKEFKRTFGDNVVDEDTMLGWFANAIETGREHEARRHGTAATKSHL